MDCVVWLATFFGCLCISIDMGLAMGLSLGLVFLFVRTAFPKFAPLQRLPGSIAYRDAEIYNLQVQSGDLFSPTHYSWEPGYGLNMSSTHGLHSCPAAFSTDFLCDIHKQGVQHVLSAVPCQRESGCGYWHASP